MAVKANPSILYWKWDDSHLEGEKFIAGIDDIISRSCFSHIYITTHWCHEGVTSDRTREIVRRAADYIHSKRRSLIFELDARAEKAKFVKIHPSKKIGFIYRADGKIDGKGNGTVKFKIAKGAGGELFLGDRQSGEKLVFCYAYIESGGYPDAGTVREISASLKRLDGNNLEVNVSGGPAGWHFCAAVCSYLDFPDFCSKEYRDFFDGIFDMYKDIPLDGAALDEMSFPWHPDFNFHPSSYDVWNSSPIYGGDMKRRYKELYGEIYEKDLFYSLYLPPEDGRRIRAINRYYEFIRNIICDEEKYFYSKVKAVFGDGCFVGVHPTWYAIEEVDNTPEVWKNGITWWDVPRDYGFTDEIMLYPVRVALAHKAGANIFYNMWYGEGTGKVETFYSELWNNVRFGGRTISLSYECLKEPFLTQLKETGALEQISGAEERIRLLDAVQAAPARSDILVVTGIESACNILTSVKDSGAWDFSRGSFRDAFILARDIFNAGYNCDLVAGYEIYNKKLYINSNGYIQYGNQEYKAALFHNLEFSKRETADFVQLAKKTKTLTRVIGAVTRDFDAAPLKIVPDYAARPEMSDLEPLFKAAGAEIRPASGCVLQDGSVIFAAPHPSKASGNRFVDTCAYNGHTVEFDAEDYIYLKFGPDGECKFVSPKVYFLKVDHKVSAGKLPE